MDIRPTLAHVWKRADGQLVLLDFPWPGLTASDANQTLNPVELLAAVSTRALAPTAEPAAPLSGTKLLNRLASGAPPALADVKTELVRLASIPSHPSRVRRALPMVMATMPVAVLVLIVTVMLPMLARSLQGDASNIFRQRHEIMTWMTWITDSGADAQFNDTTGNVGIPGVGTVFFNSASKASQFSVGERRPASQYSRPDRETARRVASTGGVPTATS